MDNKIQFIGPMKKAGNYDLKDFSPEIAEKVKTFHKSFPEYEETPLAELKSLASKLGVKNIFVKDESYRFGLNAFKALGGTYALGSYMAEKLGVDIAELSCEKLLAPETKEKLGDITFVTATDGNHGRGVAWTANKLGQKAVVYMPKGSSLERLNNIRACGAEASITDMNYDDTVRMANEMAEKNGWVMVQDTAWEGYEDIPLNIMQGYMTMASEAVAQLGNVLPTHVFLQAGVGAMAGAVCGFISAYYKDKKPLITVVEPDKADCIYKTAEAGDGKLHAVGGDLDTIMAGLACGEPCTIGWRVLNNYAESFVSMPDYVAAKGMRVLANPLGSDPRVISGESGAAGLGFVAEMLEKPELKYIKEALGIDENSVILCFSTEGATDKENYRKIVWDGLYPSF